MPSPAEAEPRDPGAPYRVRPAGLREAAPNGRPPGVPAAAVDAYVVDWRPWLERVLGGRWLATVVLAVYVGLFVGILQTSPYWSPFATADEQVTYYQVARNFNRFGFMRTLFLHDMSTASDPAFHPFVYNHMPPGPEVFTALLLKAVGEHYRVIRLVFGLVFLAGLLCYLRFAELVLGRAGLTGAGFTLLFLPPASVMHAMDHPAYSAFPLLAFGPLLLLDRHYRTGRRWPLRLAVLAVLVSSVYLVYQNLFMLVASWIALAALRIVRFERRHAAAFLGAAGLGIALHALQSVCFFGPALFARETFLALSNRVVGVPTFDQLTQFYRSIDLVHHGAQRLDLLGLGANLLSTLHLAEAIGYFWRVGETTLTLALLALVFLWGASRLGRWNWESGTLTIPRGGEAAALVADARFFAAIGAWVLATIAVPMAMFPAYSAGYGLSGMGDFFLAILVVAAYAHMISRWVCWRPRLDPAAPLRALSLSRLAPVVLSLAFLLAIGAGLYRTASVWHYRMWTSSLQSDSNPDDDGLVRLGAELGGQVAMTNVYPTMVGFFTREAVLGGCERPALLADGRLAPVKCHVAFVRGFGRRPTVAPRYWVLFRTKYFTGFSLCRDTCLDRLYADLSARYPKTFENGVYTVFDVTRLRPAPPAPGGTS